MNFLPRPGEWPCSGSHHSARRHNGRSEAWALLQLSAAGSAPDGPGGRRASRRQHGNPVRHLSQQNVLIRTLLLCEAQFKIVMSVFQHYFDPIPTVTAIVPAAMPPDLILPVV
jgi:hypothetical protein